jgi:hypothetical protein
MLSDFLVTCERVNLRGALRQPPFPAAHQKTRLQKKPGLINNWSEPKRKDKEY